MIDTNPATAPALTLRRMFNAPRERVFEAWTTPEILCAFLGGPEVTVPEAVLDVRPGGAYRITMRKSDGELIYVAGVYREVVRPERLVFTWSWEEDDPALEADTLVTLDFYARGSQTELVLTHENFRDAQQRDNHAFGWTATLEKLAARVN